MSGHTKDLLAALETIQKMARANADSSASERCAALWRIHEIALAALAVHKAAGK